MIDRGGVLGRARKFFSGLNGGLGTVVESMILSQEAAADSARISTRRSGLLLSGEIDLRNLDDGPAAASCDRIILILLRRQVLH